MPTSRYDAVVVGSGPNGLAAAISLAKAGRSVVVLEANDTIGGAARSAELTEPGFVHDIGSAIHPMVKMSPFFAPLFSELEAHGLRWIVPPAAAAHPLDGGRAGIAWNDLDRTVDELGIDGPAYRSFYEPWVAGVDSLIDLALNPVVRPPKRPIFAAKFGLASALPAATTARRVWTTSEAQGLFAGHAAHSILPLTNPMTSSFGLLLGTLAHAGGWGFPAGGAQSIVDAMVSVLETLGGEVRTGHRVESMSDIPEARATLFALTPRQVSRIVDDRFPSKYRQSLSKFRYGPGVCKVDFALDEPIPWADPRVGSAGTVHVGGTLDEVVAAERTVADGGYGDKPFVLLAQHTLFDPSRAPADKHTAWAYCHMPHGSAADHSTAIIRQIERFAPGFGDVILSHKVTLNPELERGNANLVGGDVGGGSLGGTQLFLRPRPQLNPYSTADEAIFLASASAAPGAGVHGMAGAGAAQRALDTILA